MALGISEAVDLSGRVVDLVKKGITIDLQERVMELREAVLNAKEEILGLRDEAQKLREKLIEQDDWKSRAAKYQLYQANQGAMIYRTNESPEHFACPVCFEAKRITMLQDRMDSFGTFECPFCKYGYRVLQ